MTRVAIVGNAGGGKSLLALRLSRALDLPVHSVDDVQWGPGWTPQPAALVATAHRTWLAGARWIIDGWGSWDLLTARFAAADTIVLVDFPFRIHVRWALRRQVEVALGRRRDWPPVGCSAWRVTGRLLRTMRYVHVELRPRLLAILAEPTLAARVVHLRSPHALRQWQARVVASGVHGSGGGAAAP